MHEHKCKHFPPIQRGTSFRLPLVIQKEDGTPFDITSCLFKLTMKPCLFDYDYDDQRALIVLNSVILDGPQGRADFVFKSKDTWLPPGNYFFDVELISPGNAITRLCTLETEIIGGPTNQTIGKEDNDNSVIYYSDGLHFTFTETQPLYFVAPLISQVPLHLVENFTASPDYIWNKDLENPSIIVEGPRLSFTDSFIRHYDARDNVDGPFYHFQCDFYNTGKYYPCQGIGMEMNGTLINMVGLPNDYHFELYQLTTNEFYSGDTSQGINFSIKSIGGLNCINNIKIILTGNTDKKSKIYIDLVACAPGNSDSKIVNWNVKLDWFYC